MNMEGRAMEERHKVILNKIRLQYPDVNFGIIEESKSIQLIYDDMGLTHDQVFFDRVCDIAYEHLIGEELNVFSIVYDYSSELVTNNIMSEVYNIGRYNCKTSSKNFTFDVDFTQSLTSIDEGVFAA